MIIARGEFLEAGFYDPMIEAVAVMFNTIKTEDQGMRILDLGCGEGYYCRKIASYCHFGEQIILHGIDISKFAISSAAKKQPDARFIVASSKRLPYPDQYFDFVLIIFAPSDDDELKRVLKSAGHLLIVTAGPRHLWQLKELIYTEVKEHTTGSLLPQGFKLLTEQWFSFKITPNPRQRMALLQMTPFVWRASEIVQQSIHNASELEIEIDFILTMAIRSAE